MTTRSLQILALLGFLACLSGCHKPPGKTNEQHAANSYTADEQARAAKLTEVRDSIEDEIYKFRIDTRQAYNNRRFDELEKIAGPLRASQALFRDGSWKIAQFYQSLECRSEEPEDMWQLHEQIHRDWTAAKPKSLTARLAYATFLVSYAWHARGNEYADKVTKKACNFSRTA